MLITVRVLRVKLETCAIKGSVTESLHDSSCSRELGP